MKQMGENTKWPCCCVAVKYIYFLADIPPQFAKWQLPPSRHGSGNPDKMNGRAHLCSLPFSCIFQAWGNFCAAIFFKISQMRSLRRLCFFAPAVSDRIKDLGNVITSCDTRAPLHCVNKSSCEGGCATKRANNTSPLESQPLNQAS